MDDLDVVHSFVNFEILSQHGGESLWLKIGGNLHRINPLTWTDVVKRTH